MKKVANITIAVLIACSMASCGNRSTALKNQGAKTGGTNLNIGQRSNVGVGSTVYKDGIYLGKGNKNSNGNHAAVVTITGGKITNVVLKSIDTQGKESNVNKETDASAGKNNMAAEKSTNKDIERNKTSESIAGRFVRIPGGGINVSRSERIRRDLSTAIVQQQTPDVSIRGLEKAEVSDIDNWKLAVSRALDGAQK